MQRKELVTKGNKRYLANLPQFHSVISGIIVPMSTTGSSDKETALTPFWARKSSIASQDRSFRISPAKAHFSLSISPVLPPMNPFLSPEAISHPLL